MKRFQFLFLALLSLFFTVQLSAQVYDIEDFIGTWNGTVSSQQFGGYNLNTTIVFSENDDYTESSGKLMPTIYPNSQWWTYEPETNRIGFHWLQTIYGGEYSYRHIFHEIVLFDGYTLELHQNIFDNPQPNPAKQALFLTKEGGTPPPVCPQPWAVQETNLMHTINIPSNAELSIAGTTLTVDDWMGVFYTDDGGNKVCAGTSRIDENGNATVMAFGDNPATPSKDGFVEGEAFTWNVFRCDTETQLNAAANYDQSQPNNVYFTSGGSSSLTALGGMACQEYALMEGWNSFSNYINPEIANLDDLFMAQMDDMILLKNLTSVYWPSQSINTIGNLDNNSGYVVNVSANNNIQICGIQANNNTIQLTEGWNYLPVPGACNVSAMELFGGNMDDIVLVQELIGTQVFWPELEIYSLETLEPGKAYAIKAENPITLTFPNCDGDGQKASQSIQANSIETPWGEIMMTPNTQVVALLNMAIDELQAGDAIGAFGENGEIYGYTEIDDSGMAQTITLFGNDETTLLQDGFMDGETLSYKIYSAETGESYPMEIEYDFNFGNSSGMFEAGSYSAINNIILAITGIDVAGAVSFGMYPNPATDVLNITASGSGSSNYEVEIIDATGNTVRQNSFFGNGAMDISAIPSGFYFVKISSETFNETRKLIVR